MCIILAFSVGLKRPSTCLIYLFWRAKVIFSDKRISRKNISNKLTSDKMCIYIVEQGKSENYANHSSHIKILSKTFASDLLVI